MDEIDKESFDKAKDMAPMKAENNEWDFKKPNEEEFKQALTELENPVMAQKHIAAKLKGFLNQRIDFEMKTKGILSESLRRWIEAYNNLLEKIQKALHGDKSVNLHLHKVSHSDIAEKIRESEKY